MRPALALYLVALAVRLLLVAAYPDPAYPDSAYYVEVARSIAAGRGLTVDFVWIFAEVGGRIPAEPVLPIPSNGHWLPLASFVQVPFILVLGPTAVASALPFALIGALAAPLTRAIARDAGASPFVATGAAILAAVPVMTTPFMAQPDNFSLYQPVVAGCLWAAARAWRGSGRAFAAAGLLAGLATFSRNDGLLLVGLLGLVAIADRFRGGRPNLRAGRIPVGAVVAAAGCFLLVMGPWWLRQLGEFGTLSPSTASGRALYIRTIQEWNSITGTPTLGYLLGQGLGPFVASRIGGLVAGAWIFTILVCGLVLLPFLVIGAWRRRRSADFGPFLVHSGVFFAFSGLVSAVHVPGGTFIHSAVGLAPHAWILALEGVAALVAWVAARRPAWRTESATRIVGGGVVALSVAIGLASVPSVHATWDAPRRERLAVAATLARLGVPVEDRLMTIDAASYRYFTGRGGVVLVNDPLDTIRDVAAAYGIRWLVIEARDTVPAVRPILEGRGRPGWIGAPVLALPDPTGPYPSVTLHPVCLDAGDRRCAGLAEGAGRGG